MFQCAHHHRCRSPCRPRKQTIVVGVELVATPGTFDTSMRKGRASASVWAQRWGHLRLAWCLEIRCRHFIPTERSRSHHGRLHGVPFQARSLMIQNSVRVRAMNVHTPVTAARGPGSTAWSNRLQKKIVESKIDPNRVRKVSVVFA